MDRLLSTSEGVESWSQAFTHSRSVIISTASTGTTQASVKYPSSYEAWRLRTHRRQCSQSVGIYLNTFEG